MEKNLCDLTICMYGDSVDEMVEDSDDVLKCSQLTYAVAQLIAGRLRLNCPNPEHVVDKCDQAYDLLERYLMCDLKITGATLTTTLYDMTYPYSRSNIAFQTRRPGLKSKAWAFANCFAPQVWIGLAVAIVVVALLYRWTSHGRAGFVWSVFFVLSSVLSNPRDQRPKNKAQKILVVFWYLALLFLLLCFSSVLLSFLVTPTRETGLKDLDEVADAMEQGNVTVILSKEIIPTRSYSLDRFYGIMTRRANRPIDFVDLTLHDLEPDEVAFGDQFMLETCIGVADCVVTETDYFQEWVVGVWAQVHDKHLVLKDIVNMMIHRIWAMGLDEKIKREVVHKNRYLFERNVSPEPPDAPITPLSMKELSGVFYFLIAGWCLSAIVLVLEILVNKIQIKRPSRGRIASAELQLEVPVFKKR